MGETVTKSGLKYVFLHHGDGKQPLPGDEVAVHFTAKFTNGKTFDSSVPRNKPLRLRIGVGETLKGWEEALLLMRVGDKAIFTLPPKLAYGKVRMGPIPPNTTLIYEIELLEVIPFPKPVKTAKPLYTLKSGLKFVYLKRNPKGKKMKPGYKVHLSYSGFLSNKGRFLHAPAEAPYKYILGRHAIRGFDEAVMMLRVGEAAQFVIPPKLAYGRKGEPPVRPNEYLTFEIELLEYS